MTDSYWRRLRVYAERRRQKETRRPSAIYTLCSLLGVIWSPLLETAKTSIRANMAIEKLRIIEFDLDSNTIFKAWCHEVTVMVKRGRNRFVRRTRYITIDIVLMPSFLSALPLSNITKWHMAKYYITDVVQVGITGYDKLGWPVPLLTSTS